MLAGTVGDLYPWLFAVSGRVAVLESISSVEKRTSAYARSQCRSGGYFRCSALPAGVDERDHWCGRVCPGAHRFLAINRMEAARLGSGGYRRVWGDTYRAVSNDILRVIASEAC